MLKMTVIACGSKMPSWVNEATKEYSKRLQEFVSLSLVEIPLTKRTKSSDLARIMDKEAQLIHGAIPPGARVIALAIEGDSFDSERLAVKLNLLQQNHSHVCFIIGGPEGLSPATLALSQERWSLSRLTLPHPLVRILLLETMYRAFAINNNHPYHK
ncbi:23S rRNA (pseudouridine(1915)-N(3))-methyltransferase RlmH [Legionella taurinensis]|uniref:Ribosomal RNA large subunit methyltransferase H n=1 Tax=Legionella taurinensis TaxID=70611 RepID=A0A3A5LBP7_9GAMM|nr:23S rRNA (pseudouridine(1915)-N(3))-methyltransferase RlmH [Legionella taurinensis]MDX1836803.1 23S rRNA (pseudouridine(1915)-N(3))-methyltransferase RlmH [Legionella taurinensis]PUT41222.1 23S rRNA (pseudouridine(1915)-N(3))-methyltransferase RlmH [Legionella taurinensis]PUT42347.1 23S rRNA (pseudouridine(1915)-N(3))-methyltransferase RlmH [Legionella taurinensis]PUT43872.1 23S rRNA (pseudouridine(1915)-N(3))-methyltransferase RlmH [Legionella taurinensis]PUT47128.1 23S rRNA (pseudouridine